MRHGISANWGAYAAICTALPLLWGTAVVWVLRRLPKLRSDDAAPERRREPKERDEDYRI